MQQPPDQRLKRAAQAMQSHSPFLPFHGQAACNEQRLPTASNGALSSLEWF
jgi:hypothetical protein